MRGPYPVLDKFLADRGTHLAAMIAYFALLAFVPLLFLALSLVGLAGEPDESSYLIEELRRSFPASSVDSLIDVVRGIQESSTELGIVGGIALIWGALGFFSVVESALNIVYGLPNRPFIRQKLLVLLLTAAGLAVLFAALVVGSVGIRLARGTEYVGGALAYLYGIGVSTALAFGFVWSVYTLLLNERVRWRETLPGAVFAAVILQASFQLLPLFVRATSGLVALQAFGGLALLLLWIYLMANVLVLGAEVNWFLARGRARPEEETTGLGLVAGGREGDVVAGELEHTLRERAEHLALHLGHPLDHAPERLAGEDEEPKRRRRGHRRRARDVLDQRDLAEEVAVLERRDVAPVLRHLGLALDDHEELLSGLALAAEHPAGIDLEVLRHLGELLELVPREVREERGTPETRDLRILRRRASAQIYNGSRVRPNASASARAARARWLCSRFQSSPSSATVSVSPSGTKTGS